MNVNNWCRNTLGDSREDSQYGVDQSRGPKSVGKHRSTGFGKTHFLMGSHGTFRGKCDVTTGGHVFHDKKCSDIGVLPKKVSGFGVLTQKATGHNKKNCRTQSRISVCLHVLSYL